MSVAIVLVGCAAARASVQAERAPTSASPEQREAAYATGELLIKVTPEAAQAIEEAQAAGTIPVIGIESLDQLCATYGVTAIEPVFPHAQDPEAINAKFPERAKRAPPNAELPDLSRTYLLHLSPELDVLEAASAFAQDPHVEYAQPNDLATVQTPRGEGS